MSATTSRNALVLFTLLLVLFLCTGVRAQCPPDLNVTLTTQSEVDLHLLLYPNCTTLEGLTLGDPTGSDIDDISGFIALTNLGFSGILTIENTQLTDLTGLDNLDRLFTITIKDNPVLTTLNGMNNNTSRNANNLIITDNPLLANCSVDLVCNTVRRSNTSIDISGNTGECLDEETLAIPCLAECHPDLPFLRAFYESTNGSGWDNRFGWSNTSSCSPCNWFGVTCNNDDRVTEIELISNGLSGGFPTNPAVWAVMTELESIEIRGSFSGSDRLSGPLPAGIFDLPSIKEVVLVSHNLSSFPTNFNNATTLERLRLFSAGNLSGTFPASLAGMDALDDIDITNTSLGGPLPADLFSLPSLRRVNLTNTDFDGDIPAGISNGLSLQNVRLNNNEFTSWSDPAATLDGSNTLTDFFLDQSAPFSAVMPATPFTGFPALRNFTIDGPVTGALPRLPDAVGLITYNVFNTALDTPTDLDVCPSESLLTLDVSKNNFSGPLPDIPASYPLTTLNISFNDFTGTLDERFNRPSLRRLLLNDNQLTGLLPEFLGDIDWQSNSIFTTYNNNFVGCVPENYTSTCVISSIINRSSFGNPGLKGAVESVCTSGNFCGTAGADFDALVRFYYGTDGPNWTNNSGWADLATTGDCDYCQWTGVTCDGNGRVTGLSLPNNGLSGELFPDLTSLTELTSLNLSNNAFTGCYPVTYTDFCDITTNFTGNTDLPQGGSTVFFNDAFCPDGINPCDSDCPVGPVVLTTDAEIAAFVANWPNCTNFTDDLTLSGGDITSLSPLGDTEGVEGNLSLLDLTLTSILPLSQVASIGGDLTIDDCPNITSVQFDNLETLGGGLILRDLDALTSYDFVSLSLIGGDLDITRTGLTTIDGFRDLQSITGTFTIFGNSALTSLDLAGSPNNRQATISSIGGLTVAANPLLSTLFGLPNATISGDLSIAGNTILTTCEAEAVCDKLTLGTGNIIIQANATGCNNAGEVEAACLALPVRWVDFTATGRAKTVNLVWTTADEEQNAGYTVERSRNGQGWATVGTVAPGTAGDNGLYEYAFTDTDPLAGTSFYRIRQRDLDGMTSFSGVRQVTLATAAGSVFPNPAGRSFVVSATTAQTILVHDSDGRVLRTIMHTGAQTQVQREELKSGVYWLRFSASGEVLKLVLR